jgi:hypothetical protein
MDSWQLKTPVALIIYKRPDTTARVLAEIAKAKPHKLLVIAEGPKPDVPGEAEKIAATRAIIDQVDWDCDILKNYADVNLGCGIRVSSGLSWAFDKEEEIIILEDDCLPHPTFFRFCDELLEKYRHDKRVAMISGDNFQFGKKRNSYSYYFSRYAHIWGWASWRRAWQHYDYDIIDWPEIRDGKWLRDILKNRNAIHNWENTFQIMYEKKIDTWDFQWQFACFINSGLCIMPNINLVSNIGYGFNATHTEEKCPQLNLPSKPMIFPIEHPRFVIRDEAADTFTQTNIFSPTHITRIKNKIKQLLS